MSTQQRKLSQDDVIELLRAAGIPDGNLRSLYAGHGLTLYLEHLASFANVVHDAFAQVTKAAAALPSIDQLLAELDWCIKDGCSGDRTRAALVAARSEIADTVRYVREG